MAPLGLTIVESDSTLGHPPFVRFGRGGAGARALDVRVPSDMYETEPIDTAEIAHTTKPTSKTTQPHLVFSVSLQPICSKSVWKRINHGGLTPEAVCACSYYVGLHKCMPIV